MDSPRVAQQIETPRSPDPIMRRPGADREEKRVTHGATSSGKDRKSLTSPTPSASRGTLISPAMPESAATNAVSYTTS